MNKRMKLAATGLSLAAVIGAAGIATAGQGQHGGYHHGRGMMKSMAERYDANKDGSISQDEIDQNRTAWHGEFDGNKDGGLTLQEFEALWLKARFEQMVREFQRFDRDGDGKVTLLEYQSPMGAFVAEMDRNGDGVLSPLDRGRRGKPAPEGETKQN